jgi:hypothetical protein
MCIQILSHPVNATIVSYDVGMQNAGQVQDAGLHGSTLRPSTQNVKYSLITFMGRPTKTLGQVGSTQVTTTRAIAFNPVTTSSAAATPPGRSHSFVLRRYGLAIDLLRSSTVDIPCPSSISFVL